MKESIKSPPTVIRKTAGRKALPRLCRITFSTGSAIAGFIASRSGRNLLFRTMIAVDTGHIKTML
ncbi:MULTISPECIES: hypothetical protein [Archaeoglobus]|uniref:hypothetical protein n=1 Tax=Archaeoglobus TaxID=2233 RepID=UPI00064E9A8D|nr:MULTISPECIES: hypothetical protein [Archaeoglobus]